MFELFAGLQQNLFDEGTRLLQVSVIAAAVGLTVERLVDTGVRTRGIGLLCGLTGVYFGAWLWNATGWNPGPHLGGAALLPTLAGTLSMAVFVKLAALGIAGPRR